MGRADDASWRAAERGLAEAAGNGTFTAAAALAAEARGSGQGGGERKYEAFVGTLGGTQDARPTNAATMFDLASLTKVLATTTTVAWLVEHGMLALDQHVGSDALLGKYGFARNGKANMTVRHCLAHAAGYPPDPAPNYWQPSFQCPQGGLGPGPYPATSSFACADRVLSALANQTLDYAPGDYSHTRYSDLSFITLAFAAGAAARAHASTLLPLAAGGVLDGCPPLGSVGGRALLCAFEWTYRAVVLPRGSAGRADAYPRFLPLLGRPQSPGGPCALTALPENEVPLFKHEPAPLQCRVEDGNAELLGGISGHAGLFGSLAHVAALVTDFWLPGGELAPSTRAEFTSLVAPGRSTRALGWDTNHRGSYDEGFSGVCGDVLPASSFLHIGYTGTMVCVSNDALLILLTNRAYPVDDDESRKAIKGVRRAFAEAAARAVGL